MTNSIDFGTTLDPEELDSLLEEIRRYLAAIEVFRREGCEPCWRSSPQEVSA